MNLHPQMMSAKVGGLGIRSGFLYLAADKNYYSMEDTHGIE